ncbi:hypothetical protein [Candidatus Mycoplasma haematominutum]|uniref:Uncharacterized protein n=1 Tax=Candidatus Mycoplasma haematominutum 'Birmingham 1' TaxID=1116213 RepID=G8C3R4_9MOLU|nr:hypothetical protein [Candidatus Mycoplasma haematominutum]CCE66962.1 hypothetical protein MHM_04440 [Candidatus Mycoplasma haematominutum 'Birmingham 1']
MIFFFKLCLVAVALAGISAAVAAPVVSSAAQSRSRTTSTGSASQNPITVVECNPSTSGVRSAISFGAANVKEVCWEGSSTQGTVLVEKCSTQQATAGSSAINFGAGNLTRVCWNVDSSTQLQSTEEGNITQILQASWSSPSSWGNLGISGVKSYCDSSSSSDEGEESDDDQSGQDAGLITLWAGGSQGCSGSEYLKLGSSSNAFLKKKSESGDQWKVWSCGRECWEGSQAFSETSPTQSLKENADKWRELSFQQLWIN